MIVVTRPDEEGLAAALEREGETVSLVEGLPTRDSLREAGVEDADTYVLTDAGEATSIPVVRELNPDVRIVVYGRESLPEFARGQTDLALDAALFDPEFVAEELAGEAPGRPSDGA